MAGSSSFVVSWPKNIKLSFVKPLPEDLDIYCKKCQLFMQNPHQTSCCGVHLCEDCHKTANPKSHKYTCTSKCPSCSSYQYNAFPDRAHQRRIKALEVHCIHHAKQCEWTGKLEELSAHLNYREKKELYRRYKGCSYTQIRCKHDSCFSFYVERRLLKDHEENCKHQPAICSYCCIFKDTFQQVESHYKTCGMFFVPCTHKDHKGFIIQRKNLQLHLDTDCPFQPIDCQFKWAGCNERPKRKDEDQHNAISQQNHLLLLARTCFQLKEENKELREQLKKDNEGLKEQLKKDNEGLKEQLKKDNEGLRKQLKLTNQKLDHLTQTNVERLDHSVHGDLPVTGDESKPVRVEGNGQPVSFFSDNREYKMSVRFGNVRSAAQLLKDYNIEFKVFKGNHRLMPDVREIVIKSYRSERYMLCGNDLVKESCKDNESQKILATIPERYKGDYVYIIRVC